MAYCNTAYPCAGKFKKNIVILAIQSRIQGLLCATEALIQRSPQPAQLAVFECALKCREADLDKTGGAWGGRFSPLFSRLQRLYFHRTPREPLPVQATNNCVVAPEQRGPRTFFCTTFVKINFRPHVSRYSCTL